MPFETIQLILGTAFALAWTFIGGMWMRDSLDESRRGRQSWPPE